MEDVNISIYRASVVREGSTPASPGFVVSDGQNPVDPSGSGQNHLPVTIAEAATGLSITESQVLGGAGTVGQYIRGDGSLADFPESSGGGSSVSYYLNGSVSQGTIGGVPYKELNKVPILGAGTDFTINADGYIASFITDAGDPNLLEIPGGNWNFETYFSASSSGGTPTFYVELYKVNSGGTATLIASNSGFPELIAFGTNIISYFSTLAVPTTALALTDRLAIRYYVTHSGRTITLHTEDNHLCQIITTFTTGLTALNGLTAQIQNFAVGTSGTDFAISSATATHTFNLPTASATNRGALSSADWSMFNAKQNALTNPVTGTGASGQVAYFTGTSAISSESNLFWDATNDRLGIGTSIPIAPLQVTGQSASPNNGFFLSTNTFTLSSTGSLLRMGHVASSGNTTAIIQNLTGGGAAVGNIAFPEGNLLVGTTADNGSGAKLQVSGTATVGGLITSTAGVTMSGGWVRNNLLQSAFPVQVFESNYVGTSRFAAIGYDRTGGMAFWVNSTTIDVTSNNSVFYLANSGAATFSGTITSTLSSGIFLNNSSGGTNATQIRINNTSGDLRLGIESSTGGTIQLGTLAYAAVFGNQANNAVQFTTNGTARMTITSSGNVGIGITPQGIGATKTLEIGSRGAIYDNNDNFAFVNNGWFDTSWKYKQTGFATLFTTNLGVYSFLSAASGTQNNTITWNTHLTITNSGNVLIGTTSSGFINDNGWSKEADSVVQRHVNGTAGGTAYTWFIYNASAIGSITQNGTTQVLYNTSSDYRLKTDLRDYRGLDLVSKIKTYDFEWKTDKTRAFGVIAHELQEIIEYAVVGNKDGQNMQQVDYSKIVPIMVKAIQELKQEIDTLKN